MRKATVLVLLCVMFVACAAATPTPLASPICESADDPIYLPLVMKNYQYHTPTPTTAPTSTPTSTPTPTPTNTPTSTPTPTPTPCGYVSGNLTNDTTWLENCTYVATGNVGVPEGITLTIEPGVMVLFDGYYYLQVAGTLRAEGTPSMLIFFLPHNATESWGGIQFISGTSDNTQSILDSCTIRHADHALDLRGGKNIPNITRSVIENNGCGICSMGGYTDLPMTISYSLISGNGIGGVNLRIGSNGVLTITHNTITGNEHGINCWLTFGTVHANYNNVYNNINYNVYAANVLPGGDEADIDAANNWWGTMNEAEIEASIYDCNDDLNYGCVIYQPIATSPIEDAP